MSRPLLHGAAPGPEQEHARREDAAGGSCLTEWEAWRAGSERLNLATEKRYAALKPAIETAEDAAVDLILYYVLRGDDPEHTRSTYHAFFGRDYHAQIGGFVAGKQHPNTHIIVTEVAGRKVHAVLSFGEILQRCRDIAAGKALQPALFV